MCGLAGELRFDGGAATPGADPPPAGDPPDAGATTPSAIDGGALLPSWPHP